ncbi:MAG: hypothetical protein GY913_24020 [Proteobacteria bacterium]|nr:hypothetical protein [Pseudomonadota bacterium]MCP4919981.1 hypothetical protein [Pseudomonadota bacterium]
MLTVRGGLFGGEHALVGDVQHHPFDSAWLYAGVHEALSQASPSFRTGLLLTPQPLDLLDTFADVGNPVLASPLVALIGALHAYDVYQAFQVFAAGLATYALSFTLTRRHWPALAAGLLFCVASPIWFAIEWGEDDVAAMWLLPAYLAFLFRALGTEGSPPWKAAIPPALFIAFIGYFNSYYLYFSATSTILVGLTCLARARQDVAGWARFGGVYGVTAALAYIPRMILGVRPSRKGTEEATSRVFFGVEDLLHENPLWDETSSLDLSRFLLHPPSPPDGGYALVTEGHLYIGLGVLVLAAVGLTVPAARRIGLLVVMGVAFVFACGAYLLWDMQTLDVGGLEVIPLPGGLATAVLPGMERMNHPFRWAILTFAGAAVLAGSGAMRIAEWMRAPVWLQPILAGGLVWGALLDRVWATPSIAYLDVASPNTGNWPYELPETERAGVLHLPIQTKEVSWVDLEPCRYHRILQLLAHKRPIYVLEAYPLAEGELSIDEIEAELASLVDMGVGLVLLDDHAEQQAMGVGAPLPHTVREQTKLARQNLTACGLEPVVLDPRVEAWIVPDEPSCPR